MVLSKRERYVFIGTLVAVGVLALDRFALSPLLDAISKTDTRKRALMNELNAANALMAQRRELAPKWRQMVQSGMKDDPVAAESQILHAINQWAEESGLVLGPLRPERLTEKSRMPQIGFQASGTGSISGVARLLYRAHTAAIPIKVTHVQVTARKEGTDDLSFELRFSTVYAPSRSTPATAVARLEGAK